MWIKCVAGLKSSVFLLLVLISSYVLQEPCAQTGTGPEEGNQHYDIQVWILHKSPSIFETPTPQTATRKQQKGHLYITL